jgi:hypothetical protein
VVRLLLLLLVCGDFTVSDRYVIAERGIQQVAARVAEQEEPPSHGEYYVVMFTAKWCSVCQVYKNAGRWDRVLDVFPRSVVVDLDVEPRWARAGVLPAVRSLPTFWLLNSNDTTKVLKVWQGPTDAAEFKRKIEKLQPIVTPAVNAVDAPERYIQWPGWGTIDLETYARDCNCPMCVSIRQMQADYWARKSQAAVTEMKWLISLVVVAFAGLAVSGVASSQSYRMSREAFGLSGKQRRLHSDRDSGEDKVRGTSACNGTYVPRRIVTRTKTRSSAASSGTYGSVQRTRTVERPSYGSSGK